MAGPVPAIHVLQDLNMAGGKVRKTVGDIPHWSDLPPAVTP
jgi:hypothetical protein